MTITKKSSGPAKKAATKAEAPALVGPAKFRGNLKPSELKQLIALKEDGQKWKAILKATGLSHSKAELAFMEHEAFVQADPPFTVTPLTPEFVAYARNDLRIGWGPIMVWTQSSEGAVRKAWEQATNTHSDGQRIGRGGAFKFKDPELYAGDLKPTGVAVPADQPMVRTVARESAIVTRLMALTPDQVKSVYTKATGKQVAKGWTKAKLVLELKKLNEERALDLASA